MSRWAMVVDIEPIIDPAAVDLRLKPGIEQAIVGEAWKGDANALGGTGPYTYAALTALPAWATLNTSTGAITGTPTGSPGYLEVELEVTDANANVETIIVGIDTIDGMRIVGTLAPPEDAVPYASNLTVAGAVGAVTWGMTGTIPGLSMATSGILSGTPTTPGTYPIVVDVTDSLGRTTSRAMKVVVFDALAMAVGAVLAPAGMVGAEYSFQPIVTGGITPFTFEADTDMSATFPGLTFNPNTGRISGTPTEESPIANFSVLITVTDLAGATVSDTFYFTFNQPDAFPARHTSISFTGDNVTTTFSLSNPFTPNSTTATLYEVVGVLDNLLTSADINIREDGIIDVAFFIAPTNTQLYRLQVVAGHR